MLEKEHIMKDEIPDDFLCREQTRNLFGQPDVILIHEYLQVYQSNTATTPEMRLIAAVLEDAIDCYLKNGAVSTRRGKRIFGEAEQWIFSQDDDWFFGFENICEMLKIDPDYIRRVLRHNPHEQLNKLSSQELRQDLPAVGLRLAS
jgi:hypothetical protein